MPRKFKPLKPRDALIMAKAGIEKVKLANITDERARDLAQRARTLEHNKKWAEKMRLQKEREEKELQEKAQKEKALKEKNRLTEEGLDNYVYDRAENRWVRV